MAPPDALFATIRRKWTITSYTFVQRRWRSWATSQTCLKYLTGQSIAYKNHWRHVDGIFLKTTLSTEHGASHRDLSSGIYGKPETGQFSTQNPFKAIMYGKNSFGTLRKLYQSHVSQRMIGKRRVMNVPFWLPLISIRIPLSPGQLVAHNMGSLFQLFHLPPTWIS